MEMAPAGEIWSVVTESPRLRRARALEIFETGGKSRVIVSKNGGD